MALDDHHYENGKIGRLLYQIDDKTYGEEFGAFERFKAQTGIFIDPYRDTLITGQMSALITYLKDAGRGSALLSILKICEAKGQAVIFLGD